MDYARQIGKSNEPRIWKRRRTPFVTTSDNLLSEDKSTFSESRSLANWRRWLAERKRQSRRIESLTGRPQADQLQSSSERYRALVEMKTIMEHAAIPVPAVADKYRGGPDFWKTPEFLPDRGDTCLPKISLSLTRKDRNLPPDLPHVSLADSMLNERDLAELRAKEEPWRRNKYLKTRKRELAKEIALLLPKEPETSTMVVQGHTAFRKKEAQPRIPPITVTEADEEQSRECIDQTVILKIQDREFVWQRSLDSATPADAVTWSLTFGGEIDERVEREIVLENRGSRVITYYWRDASFRSSSMPFDKRGSPFFFDKTKNLALPGQIVKIKVWYRSRVHGVFTESWRLVTEPALSPSAFVFRLWGCASDVRNAKSIDRDRMIDRYLDHCVRDSTVRAVVEEIVADVRHVVPPEPRYATLFLQSELFRSRNPTHFYHQSIAMQLREMYADVVDETAPPWDLSLDTLRDVILQIREMKHKCAMLGRFNELYKRCLRPNLCGTACVSKTDAVYNILCAFANHFEDESELAKTNSLMREESVITSEVDRQKSASRSQEYDNKSSPAVPTDRSENMQLQRNERDFYLNLQPYREMFFIRIHEALKEAIECACGIIDSFNRLNESYK